MAESLRDYVVAVDALVLRTGAKTSIRLRRGAKIRLHEAEQRTQELLHSLSIVKSSDAKKPKPTPRQVFRALGAESDPVLARAEQPTEEK